jgi:hypothetical protein
MDAGSPSRGTSARIVTVRPSNAPARGILTREDDGECAMDVEKGEVRQR